MTHLAQQIASTIAAMGNCNDECKAIHTDRLARLIRDHMPSGSGFDAGTTLDDASKPERLVFATSFHHMDDAGGYVGWTEHTVVVTPSLVYGIDVRVTGRDRNDIKNYIGEVFASTLTQEIAA